MRDLLHEVKSVAEIETPAVVIDRERLMANLAAMATLARTHDGAGRRQLLLPARGSFQARTRAFRVRLIDVRKDSHGLRAEQRQGFAINPVSGSEVAQPAQRRGHGLPAR